LIADFQYEIAFGLTIGVEYLILLALVRKSPGTLFLYALLVNGLTWPVATVVYRTTPTPYWALEAAVWIVEGVLLKHLLRTSYPRGLWLSFAANLPTALIGWFAQGPVAGG
jgi:hypothetical protein